jgi:hypothetical protein
MPQQEEIFEEDDTEIIEPDGEVIEEREEFEEVKGTAGGEGGTVG